MRWLTGSALPPPGDEKGTAGRREAAPARCPPSARWRARRFRSILPPARKSRQCCRLTKRRDTEPVLLTCGSRFRPPECAHRETPNSAPFLAISRDSMSRIAGVERSNPVRDPGRTRSRKVVCRLMRREAGRLRRTAPKVLVRESPSCLRRHRHRPAPRIPTEEPSPWPRSGWPGPRNGSIRWPPNSVPCRR